MSRNSIETEPDIRRRHQALAVLRLLQRDPAQRANDHFLADWLALKALGGSHVQVRDALNRLAELNLVVLETVDELVLAKLTERGEFVALGNVSCEGVLRAYPDCPY